MDHRVEREWKTVLCPERNERTRLLCEWSTVCEKGRILQRTLKGIDCFSPMLAELGGPECRWECQGVICRRER